MAQRFKITADLNELAGHLDLTRINAAIVSNLGSNAVVVDETNKKLHLGTGAIEVPASGIIEPELLQTNATDTNVSGWKYWLELSAPAVQLDVRNRRLERTIFKVGPFAVTANANLADLHEQFDTPATNPIWRDGFKTEMEALKSEAQTAGAANADRAEVARDEAEQLVITGSSIALGDAEAALVAQIPVGSSPIGGALSAAIADTAVSRKATVFDQFTDVADGSLPAVTDTGQPWTYLSGERGEVRNGYLTTKTDQAGYYAEINAGAPVTRMGARFRFDSDGGVRTEGGGIAINTWNDGGITGAGGGRRTRSHVDFTRTSVGWSVQRTEGLPITLEVIGGRYTFLNPLPLDTWLTVEWYISGDMGLVLCPDGTVHTVQDPILATLGDEYANWQPGGSTSPTNVRTQISHVWADAEPAQRPDGPLALAFKAATAVTKRVLRNGDWFKAYDTNGNPRSMLGVTLANAVKLQNSGAADGAPALELRNDGSWGFYRGATRLIGSTVDGFAAVGGRLDFNTAGHGVRVGNNPPEGVVDAPAGVVYIAYNGGRARTAWVKETGSGNTGWSPIGFSHGLTAQRPASPTKGLPFYDDTLSKPIWWNGAAWTDAMDTPV